MQALHEHEEAIIELHNQLRVLSNRKLMADTRLQNAEEESRQQAQLQAQRVRRANHLLHEFEAQNEKLTSELEAAPRPPAGRTASQARFAAQFREILVLASSPASPGSSPSTGRRVRWASDVQQAETNNFRLKGEELFQQAPGHARWEVEMLREQGEELQEELLAREAASRNAGIMVHWWRREEVRNEGQFDITTQAVLQETETKPVMSLREEQLIDEMYAELDSTTEQIAETRRQHKHLESARARHQPHQDYLLRMGDQQSQSLAALRERNQRLEVQTEVLAEDVRRLRANYWEEVPFHALNLSAEELHHLKCRGYEHESEVVALACELRDEEMQAHVASAEEASAAAAARSSKISADVKKQKDEQEELSTEQQAAATDLDTCVGNYRLPVKVDDSRGTWHRDRNAQSDAERNAGLMDLRHGLGFVRACHPCELPPPPMQPSKRPSPGRAWPSSPTRRRLSQSKRLPSGSPNSRSVPVGGSKNIAETLVQRSSSRPPSPPRDPLSPPEDFLPQRSRDLKDLAETHAHNLSLKQEIATARERVEQRVIKQEISAMQGRKAKLKHLPQNPDEAMLLERYEQERIYQEIAALRERTAQLQSAPESTCMAMLRERLEQRVIHQEIAAARSQQLAESSEAVQSELLEQQALQREISALRSRMDGAVRLPSAPSMHAHWHDGFAQPPQNAITTNAQAPTLQTWVPQLPLQGQYVQPVAASGSHWTCLPEAPTLQAWVPPVPLNASRGVPDSLCGAHWTSRPEGLGMYQHVNA